MSDDTLAQARAILAVCEGMTEGPWSAYALDIAAPVWADGPIIGEVRRLGDRRGIVALANGRSVFAALIAEVERLRAETIPLDDEKRDVADSALPEAMIFAGAEALDAAQSDLKNYVSGETTDWDSGMIAVAVYRAMTRMAPFVAEPIGAHLSGTVSRALYGLDRAETAEAERDRLKAENERLRASLTDLKIAIGMGWDLDHLCDTARLLAYPDPAEPLASLVARFSDALLAKLRESETEEIVTKGRYGWDVPDWADDLRRRIREHVEKGDPRDVAAFAAFAWHHGWSLAGPSGGSVAAEAERDRLKAEVERLRAALADLIFACDQGRRFERGVGGMTIEAQTKRTMINGVSAWAVECARAALNGEAPDA